MFNDNNQKINCTVTSCRYNNSKDQECILKAIVVEPCNNGSSGRPDDESMCGNYVQHVEQ